jgi:hypothetical protein
MTMKRVAMLPMLAVVLLAVGCGTQPPQWWKPPTVQALVVSTNEIVAGSSFTVSVTATDDRSVAQISFLFYDSRPEGPLNVPCDVPDWAPAPAVTVEATCTMPAVAPNGAWKLRVEAIDAQFSGGGEGACGCGSMQTALTVLGGTEDRQGPVVDSLVFAPQSPIVGMPFTVTFRASDEHPGEWDQPLWIASVPTNGNAVPCVQTSHTPLTANQHEWTFSCPAPTSVGQPLLYGSIHDAMWYSGYVWAPFDVVAP